MPSSTEGKSDSDSEADVSPKNRASPMPMVVVTPRCETSHLTPKTQHYDVPQSNCPVITVFCLDTTPELNSELHSKTGVPFSLYEIIKGLVIKHAYIKSTMNSNHKFCLATMRRCAEWQCGLNEKIRGFTTIVKDLDPETDNEAVEECDLTSIFQVIAGNIELPQSDSALVDEPAYIIQCIFIYGRNCCMPTLDVNNADYKRLIQSPYFFFDAYYIHEALTGETRCQDVFDMLYSVDPKDTSYLFDEEHAITKIHQWMPQFLAHPLQRPPQQSARYEI